MASRDPKLLVPELYKLYLNFDAEMKAAGIDYMITCTERTQPEQDTLFEQGRTTPGEIVTWIHKSKHIRKPGELGVKAFDIAIKKDGKPTWDLKVNVNKNDIPDYAEAGAIGERCGLEWGGSWTTKKKDYPHFQLRELKET
jgi:peptidoglycan L-alanyl-D-glutamate endopeptidase CwlK